MNKVIIAEKDKVLNIDIFDFIESQYKCQNDFVICHITDEEYKIMVNQIKNYGCLKEKYSRIDYIHLGYNKFRYMVYYNSKNNLIQISDYNNPDKIGAYTIDENGILFNNEMEQFINTKSFKSNVPKITNIYTTLSYEDIIEHYKNIKRKKEITSISLEDIIDKIIANTREFYIKVCNELTIEEREYLKSLIECKTCGNCSNMSCRVETYEKIGSDGCIAWENYELVGKQKVLNKNI